MMSTLIKGKRSILVWKPEDVKILQDAYVVYGREVSKILKYCSDNGVEGANTQVIRSKVSSATFKEWISSEGSLSTYRY